MPTNITGGEFSSPMLQIPAGKDYVIRYKPDFKQGIKPEEKTKILDSMVLLVQKLSALKEVGAPISFKAEISDDEVFFTIRIPKDLSAPVDRDLLGLYRGTLSYKEAEEKVFNLASFSFELTDPTLSPPLEVNAALKPSPVKKTIDKDFWENLRKTTRAISFENYRKFMDGVCGISDKDFKEREDFNSIGKLARRRFLPFNDTDSYRTIKVLTEFFLLANCAIDPTIFPGYLKDLPDEYEDDTPLRTIPFMQVIREKLSDLPIKPKDIGDVLGIFTNLLISPDGKVIEEGATNSKKIKGDMASCFGILKKKLLEPCAIELIWSYWHEEAMLVQAMSAISLRFQNRKQPGRGKDPLANMAISPLLPLNNLLWGYIQDEQHRLTVMRRAYEYDHHYGITLQGKAVPGVEGADSRSNFLEAFHTLLYRCTAYFKQVDDLNVQADGFPVLNSLREVHVTLSEGMHNQYGDLPWNARVEMLMQQWMLSRPEFREFLPSRTMVAYPEAWMGPISTMNTLQGWTNGSPINFNSLAVYGEDLLISIRLTNWLDTDLTGDNAANWANAYRNEIQGYIHAYRAVTGADLTALHPQTGKIDAQQPAVHLLRRAKAGANGNGRVREGALAQ
jgi:hypothetical protein